MNIALVNPAKIEEIQKFRWGSGGHLGLAYLAGVLEAAGYRCSVIDAKFHGLNPEDVFREIRKLDCEIIGITAMTHEVHTAHLIAQKIKEYSGTIVTVVGGPHATALPERTLLEFPGFDIAVFGEGENTILEIVKHYNAGEAHELLRNVNGCAFRLNGSIVKNSPRPFMNASELDKLPFPAWHLFPNQPFPQLAGRGCPYRCAFCMRVLGNAIRMRSPQNVIDEMEYLYREFGRKESWFRDETFGIDKKWTDDFLLLLEKFREMNDVDWSWKANSRVNIADYETYSRMHRLGCRELDFGIESGNVEVLRQIQKDITLEKAQRAISMAKKAGIRARAFFIIGHPHETLRTAFDTIRFAARLGSDEIAVGVMVPYPGTKIWMMAQRHEGGYTLLSEDWRLYDKYFGDAIELEHLSKNQLKALQSICYVWFYIRNLRIIDLCKFIKLHFAEAKRMLKILAKTNSVL